MNKTASITVVIITFNIICFLVLFFLFVMIRAIKGDRIPANPGKIVRSRITVVYRFKNLASLYNATTIRNQKVEFAKNTSKVDLKYFMGPKKTVLSILKYQVSSES